MRQESFKTDQAAITVFLDGPLWNDQPTATLGGFRSRNAKSGQEVLSKAIGFARQQGVEQLIGPMEGDSWHSYRFITDTDGSPPFLMEPNNQAHELEVFMKAGFRQIGSYFSARVPLTRIVSEPEENVYLAADDVVAFLRRPQTFTVFGAAGTNREVDFPLTGIMLDEALARVGGLVDLRSDPAGVFVFRYEQPAVARALDDPAAQAAGRRPVVYRLDLRDPKGLFRAKRFEVADGDLVYVANANLNELQKFVALVNGLAQPPLVVRRAAEAF